MHIIFRATVENTNSASILLGAQAVESQRVDDPQLGTTT